MTCVRRNLNNRACCNSWQKGIRTINNQYPDDNREFEIAAGDGITITPITGGVLISSFYGDVISWDEITDKPSTVSGYGITDAVDTVSDQNITGVKTFTEAKTTTRPYASANINDIVTIGSLVSNPSVLHSVGNEVKSGSLMMNGPDYVAGQYQASDAIGSKIGDTVKTELKTVHDSDDSDTALLTITDTQNKTVSLRLTSSPATNTSALWLLTRNGTWHQIASFTD